MLTIAVDGYASSGKGIVCSKIAKRLGIVHFETGAIYRAIGLYVLENNIDAHNEEEVINNLKSINITLKHSDGNQITILNGKDVSRDIRSSEVSNICSIVSPYEKCREFVLNIQRNAAETMDLIMEGRDITSHVLPNAKFKFFLDADIDVRSKRRFEDLKINNPNITLEQVKADLIERDRRDITRELSPLILTEGTIHIDNSYMSIDEEVELMINIIKGEK